MRQLVVPADLRLLALPTLLALVFISLLAVLVRIHVEEAELATALGPEYARYASRTHRLVPGLW